MDFTRKYRWVKDGHQTPYPESSSYAGVVLRESTRILLTHVAMYGVPIMVSDVCNAYLQDPTSEKHVIICWPEFGIEKPARKLSSPGPSMAENAPGETLGTTSEAA